MNNTKAIVFDAYGTLFDVNSAAEKCKDKIGDKWETFANYWRTTQLEYTWLRSLMKRYKDVEFKSKYSINKLNEEIPFEKFDSYIKFMFKGEVVNNYNKKKSYTLFHKIFIKFEISLSLILISSKLFAVFFKYSKQLPKKPDAFNIRFIFL